LLFAHSSIMGNDSSSSNNNSNAQRSGTCPKGHALREHTPKGKYPCDQCGQIMEPDTPFYGCRTCNFDKCLYCHLGKSKSGGSSRTVQSTSQTTTRTVVPSRPQPKKSSEIPSKNRSKDFDVEKCLMSPTDANKQAILKLLEGLQPSGKTSLFDAIANGSTSAYALALALLKATVDSPFNIRLVNLVLTDGEDTSDNSDENFKKLGVLLRLLHGTELDLEDSCQTFLVGIGDEDFSKLKILATVCGKYCTFQQVSDVKIESLFEQIEVKIGIAQRYAVIATEQAAIIARKQELALQVQENRYVVIFTIDHSGSMAGARWERVKKRFKCLLREIARE